MRRAKKNNIKVDISADLETMEDSAAEALIVDRVKARIIVIAILISLVFLLIVVSVYARMYPKDTGVFDVISHMVKDGRAALGKTSAHLSENKDLNQIIAEAQQHSKEIVFDPSKTWRSDIVDRNGALLATSLPSHHLFINRAPFHDPNVNLDINEVTASFNEIFEDFDEKRFKKQMQAKKGYVRVKTFVTPKERNLLYQHGIPAMRFDSVFKRYYPQGMLTSHPIGISSNDAVGLSGFEYSYNEQIRNSKNPIELSIDIRLQQVIYETLAAQMQKFSAIAASAILVDIQTGEILSLVSLPSFDPNDFSTFANNPRAQRSLLVQVWEQGSTMKLLNAAIGFETGKLKVSDTINASRPITFKQFKIDDYEGKYRALNIPEVMVYSSNIASAKIAERYGINIQKRYFDKFHLLKTVTVEGLSGYDNPLYPKKERGLHWGPLESMTMAYGHGIAVSPLQVMHNYVMIASGGVSKKLTLLKTYGIAEQTERVISAKTAAKLRKLMRLVVRFGSGKNANAEGYQVGGKTGTADKPSPKGGYDKSKVQASFAGVFPIDNPQYAIYVAFDEPKAIAETGGHITAGWVAAPAVKTIIQKIAPIVGLKPIKQEKSDKVSLNNPYSLIQYVRED